MAPMGACLSAPKENAPTVQDLFNPAFMVKMAVVQVKSMGDLLNTWMNANKKNVNLLPPGAKRTKRYEALLDHCQRASKLYDENPEDVQGVMDILTDMQQYGAPPDEVVRKMNAKLGPGETLNFIEVDDTELAVVETASLHALRIAKEAMNQPQKSNAFKSVVDAYLKKKSLESVATGRASESTKAGINKKDSMTPKQIAKMTNLLAKAMSIPPAAKPGPPATSTKKDPKQPAPKPVPPSEDEVKYELLPKLEEKTKLWDDEDMKVIMALLDAPDQPSDVEDFINAGKMSIKECVLLAVQALRDGCAAKKIVLEERIAGKYHTKLSAQWHDLNLTGEKLVKAKNDQCNLAKSVQMTKEQLEGALVFIDLDLHSLPADLKAQDGFDNCRTALCKACANGHLDVVKQIFDISNDEDDNVLAQRGGYPPSVSDAWKRGMSAPTPLVPVPPLVECFAAKDKDVAAKMGNEIMMIFTPSPKLIVDSLGTTLLMASLAVPGIALKLLRLDNSRDTICAVDKTGSSILHKLAFIKDSVVVAKTVLAMPVAKSIIRQTDLGQSTPLMIAAYYENNEYAKLLIEADPLKAHLTMGSFGTTPLGCSKGDLTAVIQAALDADTA